MRRVLALWLLLFAVYAGTLGLRAFGDSEYGGDEPHYLLAAHSIVEDGDLDVLDDYREREYDDFFPYELDMHGQVREGVLHEPHGVGFPLLIAPAYALGGERGVELLMAALAALAVAISYALALRVVPDPWALGAALAFGLSPPMLAYGTAVYPETAAAAALAGATLLALRLNERVRRRYGVACFALLGTLPWLGTKFLPAGIVVAVFAVARMRAQRRALLAIGSVELALFSVATYVGVNEALYDGPTPYAGDHATDAEFPLGYLERSYRIVALWIDRDYGLLSWAPVLVLALLGLWLFARARRERLVRVLPEHHRAQAAAGLCAATLGAQVAVAAFLAPTMFGFWFPGRHVLAALPLVVPLVAWGLRHVPRTGVALAALTVAGSAWLYLDVRLGEGRLAVERPDAPWGPLADVFPYFGDGAFAYVVAALVAAAVCALLLVDARHWRRIAGVTRAKYSG